MPKATKKTASAAKPLPCSPTTKNYYRSPSSKLFLKGTTFPPNLLEIRTGVRIVEARQAKGLTQAALAKRLGISAPTLLKFEHGKIRLSVAGFITICRALKINPAEMLRKIAR